jgi:intraflagellar transport protein 46
MPSQVLDIKIRVMSKHSGVKPMTVRSIENADKYPKKISSWIQNIEEVHRKKPPPSVSYSKNMPDIETLMQVWPSELEELFKEVPLPQAELDMELADYVRVVCAILDIPVYDKLTESLHVLFTLYTEFKSNSHFQAIS